MRAIPKTYQSISKARSTFKLKPFTFPEGFVLIQDSREQESPLMSRLPPGLTVMSKKLERGDFSILGLEDKFAIERKQLSDLLSYITTERETKTLRKMREFKEMDWVGLVVELERPGDLWKPYVYSKVSPEAVRQALVSFSVRYGVHVFIGNSEYAVRAILDHAIKYYKVAKEL